MDIENFDLMKQQIIDELNNLYGSTGFQDALKSMCDNKIDLSFSSDTMKDIWYKFFIAEWFLYIRPFEDQ